MRVTKAMLEKENKYVNDMNLSLLAEISNLKKERDFMRKQLTTLNYLPDLAQGHAKALDAMSHAITFLCTTKKGG